MSQSDELNPGHKGLRWIHRYNAVFISLFLLIHLATHVSGVIGVQNYNAVQAFFRIIYRQPVLEIILLASVTLQLAVGLILLVGSLRRRRPSGFWARAQILSGGIFFLFMAQHLFSLGMARLYFGLDTDFFWPASVMSGPPFVYYFVAYYFFGVWAVVSHLGIGIRYWLVSADNEALANRVGVAFVIAGAIISAFIIPIISGVYFEIHLPQEWIDYLRFYDPSFQPW